MKTGLFSWTPSQFSDTSPPTECYDATSRAGVSPLADHGPEATLVVHYRDLVEHEARHTGCQAYSFDENGASFSFSRDWAIQLQSCGNGARAGKYSSRARVCPASRHAGLSPLRGRSLSASLTGHHLIGDGVEAPPVLQCHESSLIQPRQPSPLPSGVYRCLGIPPP